MITVFVGEQRGHRIKLTTDRDCLSPDIIRFEERTLPAILDLLPLATALEARGFRVCIDTEELFYETKVTA